MTYIYMTDIYMTKKQTRWDASKYSFGYRNNKQNFIPQTESFNFNESCANFICEKTIPNRVYTICHYNVAYGELGNT